MSPLASPQQDYVGITSRLSDDALNERRHDQTAAVVLYLTDRKKRVNAKLFNQQRFPPQVFDTGIQLLYQRQRVAV